MTMHTEMVSLTKDWKEIDFLLLGNNSGVDIEIWPGETAPGENAKGLPILNGTGIDTDIVPEETIFRFRSVNADVDITVTRVVE